jgi:hypothetical protein
MENTTFTAEIVRHLKGAPLSAFLLLSREQEPVSQSYIQSMSGYTDKTVESAMLFLLEQGVVTRVDRYHWKLSGQMRVSFDFPFSIRGYKGAPLSVLVLLSLVSQPISQGYLQRMSGYTDMTVQAALLFLLDAGRVARIDRYHWQLTSKPMQLHLGVTLPPDESLSMIGPGTTPKISVSPRVVETMSSVNFETTPNNSESPSDILNATPNNSESFPQYQGPLQKDPAPTQKISESVDGKIAGMIPKNSVSVGVQPGVILSQEGVTPNFSDSGLQSGVPESEYLGLDCPSSSNLINLSIKDKQLLLNLGESEKLRVAANLKECDEWGIKEPARTQISIAAHVDYILIRYHCSILDESDRGLSIYRIKQGYRVDKKWLEGQGLKSRLKEIISQPQQSETVVSIPQEDWINLLTSVESEFRRADFITWLMSGTVLIDQSEDEWTIGVANPYTGKWVRERALAVLEKTAGVRIKIVCNGAMIV